MTDEKIRAAVEIAQKAIDLAHRVPPEGLKKSKELVTLARAVVELAEKIKNERDKHFEDATFMTKMINSKTKKIYRLEAELAALKEKYRWRKQSEEPAPDNLEIEIYDISANAIFVPEGPVYIANSRYWRPLDLPDTEDAE